MPMVEDIPHWCSPNHDGWLTACNLIAKSTDFFSRQPRHYGNARDVGRTASKSIVGACNIDKGRFGNLRKFTEPDPESQQNPGHRPQDNEEGSKNLPLNFILHGREIY